MSSKLLELRPNRNQLSSESNFGGYKLSLKNNVKISTDLEIPVHRKFQSTDQYSFLHAKLFALHNHLIGDTLSNDNSVYFIDEDLQVQKANLEECAGYFTLIKVWQIPNANEQNEGDYNFTLKFASEKLAVLSNGSGMLYILETGIRNEAVNWKCYFYEEVIDKKFIIQDVVHIDNKLHCLLLTVEHHDCSVKKTLPVLYWLTLTQTNDELWGATALRELKGKGDLFYAYLEPGCNGVYIVSEGGFKFTIDSECPIETKTILPTYNWEQTTDDLTLMFDLPNDPQEQDLNVNIQTQNVDISYRNIVLLRGTLNKKVIADLTTWTLTNNVLKIILFKDEVGSIWPDILNRNENHCEMSAEIHQRLEDSSVENEVIQADPNTIFSKEVEECDFEDLNKTAVFERISCTSHESTHYTSFPSDHFLLTANLSSNLPPAIAIKYDVDGCLWQPLLINDDFLLQHEATLVAFGYIQASKQQRKFSVCAPDLSYSVICEADRHIFIYQQNKMMENAELRNRTSGRRFDRTFEQQVFTISDEILGIFPTNKVLYLLTSTSIVALKL